MPFDGRDNTPALNRARLIEALRAEMPAGFSWDYSRVTHKTACGTVGCAIGLACQLWPDEDRLPNRGRTTLSQAAEFFGINSGQVYHLFLSPGSYGFGCDDYDRVTPLMVADALERLT